MQKRIAGIEDDVILLGGLAVGGYFLYKQLFPGPPSQDDANKVTDIYSTPDANNPFSINFKYSLYAQNPGTYNQQWWTTLSQNYAALLNNGQNPASVSGVYNYITWGMQIKSCFGLITIDFQTILGIFQQLNSQADVSNIAASLYFSDTSINLWNLLSNGTGSIILTGGLSISQLAQLINLINGLPPSN